jgi:uncharacterized DUF497 family protein
MIFDWNEEKNNHLKNERGIGFERIILAIEDGHVHDVLEHPNKEKYKHQYILLVEVDEYIYVVPAVKEKGCWFLKTIFPSRKYTDLFLPDRRRKK